MNPHFDATSGDRSLSAVHPDIYSYVQAPYPPGQLEETPNAYSNQQRMPPQNQFGGPPPHAYHPMDHSYAYALYAQQQQQRMAVTQAYLQAPGAAYQHMQQQPSESIQGYGYPQYNMQQPAPTKPTRLPGNSSTGNEQESSRGGGLAPLGTPRNMVQLPSRGGRHNEMRPPNQMTLTSAWAPTNPENRMLPQQQQQQYQQAVPQQQQPVSRNGVPPKHFLVSYDVLLNEEAEALTSCCPPKMFLPASSSGGTDSTATATSNDIPPNIRDIEPNCQALDEGAATTTDQPPRISVWGTSCDVCLAFEPMQDVSNFSASQLYRIGRAPNQSHQCQVCGIVVHRACYGIFAALLDKPLFPPPKKTLSSAAPTEKKFVSAPHIPVAQGPWERPVQPLSRTSHCRFLCDVCFYIDAAFRSINAPDVSAYLPLGGRCVLCAGQQGPRKLVKMQLVDGSTLPQFAFAHPFCILTSGAGICDVGDWKCLDGIVIKEAVLLHRRAQITPHIKGPASCALCGYDFDSSVGMGLELCQHFREVSEKTVQAPSSPALQPLKDEERCSQLFHPLCLRSFVADNEQRRDLSYAGAFEPGIALRALPQGPKSKTLAFGNLRCLVHSFQGDQAAHKSCGACDASHEEHSPITQPVHMRQLPIIWAKCRQCASNIHVFCYERVGGLCRRCQSMTEAYRILQEEWQLLSLTRMPSLFEELGYEVPRRSSALSPFAKTCVARFRISQERFTKTLRDTLTPPVADDPLKGLPSLEPDAFVSVLSWLFFSLEVSHAQWQRPIGSSMQAYLVVKAIHIKRQTEWLLAAQPEQAFKVDRNLHPLLNLARGPDAKLSSLTPWLALTDVDAAPLSQPANAAASSGPGAPPPPADGPLKKRINLKKQTKPTTATPSPAPSASTSAGSLDILNSLAAPDDTGPSADESCSATRPNTKSPGASTSASRSRADGAGSTAASRLASSRSRVVQLNRSQSERPLSRKRQSDSNGEELTKKRRKPETIALSRNKDVMTCALTYGCSLFSLLLLVSLAGCMPVSSEAEQSLQRDLLELVTAATQHLADIENGPQPAAPIEQAVQTMSVCLGQIETLRRAALRLHPSLIGDQVEDAAIASYSGAAWIRSLISLGSDTTLPLTFTWKDPDCQKTISTVCDMSEPVLTILGASLELRSVQWLVAISLMKFVVKYRMIKVARPHGSDDTPVIVEPSCVSQVFQFGEMRSAFTMVSAVSPNISATITSAPNAELEKHLHRYANLFRLLRKCAIQEGSVFDNPERIKELPNPFYSSLAIFFSSSPLGFNQALPSTLLPSPILFHAQALETPLHEPLGALLHTFRAIQNLCKEAASALRISPTPSGEGLLDIDWLRTLLDRIRALGPPEDALELKKRVNEMEAVLSVGVRLEALGEEAKADIRTLKLFVKALSPKTNSAVSDDKSTGDSALKNELGWTIPPDLLPHAGRFTSAALKALPELITETEQWRRQYAKLRAMIAPLEISERGLNQPRKKAKFKFTPGGAVKVAGETGFLRPTSGTSEGSAEFQGPTRLVFSNQVPLKQAQELLVAGKSLGLALPELTELEGWVQLCRNYEIRLAALIPIIAQSVLLKVYGRQSSEMTRPGDNFYAASRLSSLSAEDLMSQLPHVARPCLSCTATMLASPLVLQCDFTALPFLPESGPQKSVMDSIVGMRDFLVAVQTFIRATAPNAPLTLDLERELLIPAHLGPEASAQLEMPRRRMGRGDAGIDDLASWLAQAAEIFETVGAQDPAEARGDMMLLETSSGELDPLNSDRGKGDNIGPLPADAFSAHFTCSSCLNCPRTASAVFKKVVMKLLPAFKFLCRIRAQILIERLPSTAIASHIVNRISVDARFHPVAVGASAPLSRETIMVESFHRLCAEVCDAETHAYPPWADQSDDGRRALNEALISQSSSSTADHLTLDQWIVAGACLLFRLKIALNGALSCHPQFHAYEHWREVISSGLESLMNMSEATRHVSENYTNGNSADATDLVVPWSTDLLMLLMLRSLSLLGLFRHYLPELAPSASDGPQKNVAVLVVVLHECLSKLLQSVSSAVDCRFDQSIFAIVRQATWEARAREAVHQARRDLRTGSVKALNGIAAILQEVDSLAGPQSLSEDARAVYREARYILDESSLRVNAVAEIIPWLKGLNKPGEVFASETLMLNLITQKLKAIAADEAQNEEILVTLAAELQSLLLSCQGDDSGEASTELAVGCCEALRQPPQNCLIWRHCKSTCRLLLTPPAAPLFELSPEIVAIWLRNAQSWVHDTWNSIAGSTIAGQVAAMDAMRMASSNPSLRALMSTALADSIKQVKSDVSLGVLNVFEAADGAGGFRFDSTHVSSSSPPSLLLSAVDDLKSDICWRDVLSGVPWGAVMIAAHLQGVANCVYVPPVDEGLYSFDGPDEIIVQQRTSLVQSKPNDSSNGALKAELEAFLQICQRRRFFFTGLVGLTIPADFRCNGQPETTSREPDVAAGSGTIPQNGIVAQIALHRRCLNLAAEHAAWMERCIIALQCTSGKVRSLRQLKTLASNFLALKESILGLLVMEDDVCSNLMSDLLFGTSAKEWTGRLGPSHRAAPAVTDLFIGGPALLELRRALALGSESPQAIPLADSPGADRPAVALGALRAKVVALAERTVPADIPDLVHNVLSLGALRELTPLTALVNRFGESVDTQEELDSDNLELADESFLFLPDGAQMFVPSTWTVHREAVAEIVWLESLLCKLLAYAILGRTSCAGLSPAAASVIAHLSRLLIDPEIDAPRVEFVGLKTLWSVLTDEVLLVCVALRCCVGGEDVGASEIRLKFLHPLTLLALNEAASLAELSDEQALQERLRHHFESLSSNNLVLPRSLTVCSKLLGVRFSVTTAVGGPALSYKVASEVLARLDVLMQRSFPLEALETIKALFSVKLNPVQATTPELCEFLELLRKHFEQLPIGAESKGLSNITQFESRNTFITTHPPKLCLFDLVKFQQHRQAFQPLADKATALITGGLPNVALTDEVLSSLLEQAENLTHRTRVAHPVFESMAMHYQERLSLTCVIEATLIPYRNKCIVTLRNALDIFETAWRRFSGFNSLDQSTTRTLASADLLFHFWDMSSMTRELTSNVLSYETVRSWRNRFRQLIYPGGVTCDQSGQPDPEVMGNSKGPLDRQSIVLGALTDIVSRAEGPISDVLKEFQTALQGDSGSRITLGLMPRLFCLPPLPYELTSFLSPGAPLPDFGQVLGFPTPFALLDVAVSPKIEVSRAICAWTCFIVKSSLQLIEVHEVLFNGPDASVVSDEGLRIAQLSRSLGCAETYKRSCPEWQQAVEDMLPQLACLVSLTSLGGKQEGSPAAGSWTSLLQILTVRLLKAHLDSPRAGVSLTESTNVTAELRWAVYVLGQFPLAWRAVDAFVNETGIPKTLQRCLWETIAVILPCKGEYTQNESTTNNTGDPYSTSQHQPVLFEPVTKGFILPPLSSTTQRLFALGKHHVRECKVVEMTPTEVAIQSHPPSLQPLLRSFYAREAQCRAQWVRRADRLIEALKNTLQHGKLVMAEARSSLEAFVMRLALQGVAPALVLSDDLATSCAKLESKFGVTIEVGDSVLTSKQVKESTSTSETNGRDTRGLREGELHRVNWMASMIGPSVVVSPAYSIFVRKNTTQLAQVSRRGSPCIATTCSPQFASLVGQSAFGETRERLLTRCRNTEAIPSDRLSMYDLIMKTIVLHNGLANPEASVPETDLVKMQAALESNGGGNGTDYIFPDSLFRSVYSNGVPTTLDNCLLPSLAAHCIVSPFGLELLGNPVLISPDPTRPPTKAIYPSMIAFSTFLKLCAPRDPDTSAGSQRLSPQASELVNSTIEALHKLLVTVTSGFVFTRTYGEMADRNGTLSNSAGLFFSSTADSVSSQANDNQLSRTTLLPPPTPAVRLLPELEGTGRRVTLDCHHKRSLIEDTLRNNVGWWGPVMSVGPSLQKDNYVTPVLIEYAAEMESSSLDTLMQCIASFVKFRPDATGDIQKNRGTSVSVISDEDEDGQSKRYGCLKVSPRTEEESSAAVSTDMSTEATPPAGTGSDEERPKVSPPGPPGTLKHFMDCLIEANSFDDVCDDCRSLTFQENCDLESPWVPLGRSCNFVRAARITPELVATLPLMLKAVTPLRLPVVVLPEHREVSVRLGCCVHHLLQAFIEEIVPSSFDHQCTQKVCALGKSRVSLDLVVGQALKVLRFDADFHPAAKALMPTIRVSLFVSLSDRPFHKSFCCGRTKNVALKSPIKMEIFGSLLIYDARQLEPIPSLWISVSDETEDNDDHDDKQSIKLPAPTLVGTAINEPPEESIVIKDPAEAITALRRSADQLSRAAALIEEREPLLATQLWTQQPPILIPQFSAVARPSSNSAESPVLLSQWSCSTHGTLMTMSLSGALNMTMFKARSHAALRTPKRIVNEITRPETAANILPMQCPVDSVDAFFA